MWKLEEAFGGLAENVMTRVPLPQRRPAELFETEFRGIRYTVCVGRYVDQEAGTIGPIGEVFIDCGKSSSDLTSLARDAAVAISIALQHGAALETLTSAMTRTEGGSAAGLAGIVLDEILRRERSS